MSTNTLNRKKPLLVRANVHYPDGSTAQKTVRFDDVPDRPEPVHQKLPDELRQRAVKVFHRVAHYTAPAAALEKFLDQLRYDQHPNREITIWECIAGAFESIGGPLFGAMQKRATARALLGISMGVVDVSAYTGVSDSRVAELRKALEAEYRKVNLQDGLPNVM